MSLDWDGTSDQWWFVVSDRTQPHTEALDVIEELEDVLAAIKARMEPKSDFDAFVRNMEA